MISCSSLGLSSNPGRQGPVDIRAVGQVVEDAQYGERQRDKDDPQDAEETPGHHAEEDQDRMRPEGVALDTGPSAPCATTASRAALRERATRALA